MLAKKTSEMEAAPQEVADLPTEAELLQQLVYAPADAVEVGKNLPEPQRARIAQFCYNRVHMRELGLRLAAMRTAECSAVEPRWEISAGQGELSASHRATLSSATLSMSISPLTPAPGRT